MHIPKINTNHLLIDTDFSKDEALSILNFAAELKSALRKGKKHEFLKGKTLAMIFEKNSTRTRVSFETGMYQLGGKGIYLNSDDIQISRGESIPDTAQVLSRYVNGIMIRTDKQSKVEELAAKSAVPVINGLTDIYHPCQAYADMFTIYEREKTFSGVKLAYIGDGNNMANSLLLASALLGIDIAVASPKGYLPDAKIAAKAKELAAASGANVLVTSDIKKAVQGAAYLYTDVWTSMGQEKEAAKRKKAFTGYAITKAVLKQTGVASCKVMHCLPAHRGMEIAADVMDSNAAIVFDQAENRLHVQKAILCCLMTK